METETKTGLAAVWNGADTEVLTTCGYMVPIPSPHPCPTCGACPTCGRRYAQPYLPYPFWGPIWTQPAYIGDTPFPTHTVTC